ncbi:hypothetical protein KHS38_02415 [Mucilaginibacter sp. Bleaf8]|uniref:hypothetical protein n=1 Tax=Mucilaginibacter sp. Bleaf8 TaxID=2834430 RepID=UPI001BD1BCD5|nr:hypothetical protein [Mucilaginibacter sp. Bleaf8]MBS7563247.1 hypothetical protein [Mucilaginibacter sp. Bleaf8]
MNSTLEITDNEFLIKLDRKKFNVSFVRNLLKMVEFTSPSEDSFAIADRYYTSNSYSSSEPDYFSNLDEK